MSHYDHAVLMHYKLDRWDEDAWVRQMADSRARQDRWMRWVRRVFGAGYRR